MKYKIHHVQITVRDVNLSEKFYDVLMEALGFNLSKKYKGYLAHADMNVVEYIGDDFDFGISSPKEEFANETIDARKPGALQHMAFRAESREAVNDILEVLQPLGINILHNEARVYTKIGPQYYAVFFEDPDGIRLEVFHDGM